MLITSNSDGQKTFCSVESIEAGEQLIGTAPRADVWFLLEYPGRWANKALKESGIPDAVKAHLNAQMERIPESRLLLIKQSNTEHAGIAFFAALPAANPPAIYRFQLTSYEDLLDLDLGALVAQEAAYAPARSEEPVFVVCTNGLRDQCCALHGVATYWALVERYPDQIWESTHHGGHRFAANFLHLPAGLSFGRLRPENALEVVEYALSGRMLFYNLRGRTIYAEPVQAAETMLRRAKGLEHVNGLALRSSEDLGGGRWLVKFGEGELVYEVTVQREETGKQVHQSCGDEKVGPVVEYRLVESDSA